MTLGLKSNIVKVVTRYHKKAVTKRSPRLLQTRTGRPTSSPTGKGQRLPTMPRALRREFSIPPTPSIGASGAERVQ